MWSSLVCAGGYGEATFVASRGSSCLIELSWSHDTRAVSHSTQLKLFFLCCKCALQPGPLQTEQAGAESCLLSLRQKEQCHSGVWLFGWLLGASTAPQLLILGTSFLCSLVLVFPSAVFCYWIAFTRHARRLRCIVAYVVPSKIISVGVLSSCHDTTHLLGSQKCCELCVFFSSSSSYTVIEVEPIEVLHTVYLAKIASVPSSCPYMLGKEDVFC